MCLSFKTDEEEEEGCVVHRKSLRKTLREENIARVKPVQYLFIFYCGKSMLLSILPYNNNKVFFMYTSVSCVLIVFYGVFASTLLPHHLLCGASCFLH